jgi:carboxyl-terminal processing protease
MLKHNRITKLSIVFVLVLSILATGYSYAGEVKENIEELDKKLENLKVIIKTIEEYYKGDVTEEELMEGAYDGIFDVLDPHSTYFTPEEYKEFSLDMAGSFGGIGIQVGVRNSNITIIAPIEGTPGDKAGLRPGDIIKYVDDTAVSGDNLTKAVKLMRGEPGTKVRLGIIRPNNPEIQYFDIVRDVIKINPVKYEIIKNNIGYIKIISFNQNTNENVKKALEEFKEKDVKGIILDLRNNPGGILGEVVKISDYFLPEGSPIVHIDYKGDERLTHKAELPQFTDKPLAVLVNGGSASASEIFAGAMQDTKRGIIIGTKTYGKGTVQTSGALPDGGGIKLTIAEYLTPNERKIDGIGLTPDIVIKNPQNENKEEIKDFAPMIEEEKPHKGDKGLNVYGAQQRLAYIGYDVDVTGIMDQKTVDAIMKFQESEGLYPYGVLDWTTRDRLKEKAIEVYYSGTEDLQLEKAVEELISNRR